MRTSVGLAIFATTLIVGALIACGSTDSGTAGPRPGTGGTGAGGGKAGGGGSSGNVDGGGGAGNVINMDSGPNDAALPDACAGNFTKATLKPAFLYLAIDKTGSMNCNPPPDQTTAECNVTPAKKIPANPSKWEITYAALNDALTQLKSMQPQPYVGIALFNKDGYCGIPDGPDAPGLNLLDDTQAGAISSALQAVVPKGDTPIVGTMFRAYDYLYNTKFPVDGNKFVVLLTDGAETCDTASMDALYSAAEQATWVGIRTFVLGAPGSEPARHFLSRLAFYGGTASSVTCDFSSLDPTIGDCHIDMTQPGTIFATALADALEKVSGSAMTCEIDVPQPDGGQADPNKVNVIYVDGNNNQTVISPAAADGGTPCDQMTTSGWMYTDASKTKIVVCGPMCEQIKTGKNGSLSVQLGCDTVVPK